MPPRSAHIAGRLKMTLFFGVFLAVGIFFFGIIAKDVLQIIAMNQWERVPAEILSASVVETGTSGKTYAIAVSYRYDWNGRPYTSERFHDSRETFSSYSEALKKISDLTPGAKTFCLLNPKNPAESVLRSRSPWLAALLLLPSVFILIGGAGLVSQWKPPSTRKQAVSGDSSGKSLWIARAVGLMFFLIGGGLLIFLILPLAIRAQASVKWVPTPCTILSSGVKSHKGENNTTYSVAVLYRYTVNGREYKSDAYGLMSSSTSGRASKEKITAQYPAGSEQTCHVNPQNPAEAVLKPGLGWEIPLFGFIPLVFLGIGLAIFAASWKQRPNMQVIPDAADPEATIELRPANTPIGRFASMAFFALLWNGITAVFLNIAIQGFSTKSPEWSLAFILIPFVVVGIGSLVATGYFGLALGNPRCRLRLTPGTLRPGTTPEVAWTITGAKWRLQRLHIILEGREEIVYRSGKSHVRKRGVFARLTAAEADGFPESAQGAATWNIPADVPLTFRAPHNKIIWTLKVHGDIPNRPDLNEEYEVAMIAGKP